MIPIRKVAAQSVVLTCSVAGLKAQGGRDDDGPGSCRSLPSHSELKAALVAATAAETNAANVFSLDPSSIRNGSGQLWGLALSTANLYAAVQPGGSLYGLPHTNPVDTDAAYQGQSTRDGMPNAAGHQLIGGPGASGDTPCADHNIAWRVRNALRLDHMAASGSLHAVAGPAGLFAGDPARPDNIIFDITPNPNGGTGISSSGFGHPMCLNRAGSATLPAVRP